jgi:hypothetical protein
MLSVIHQLETIIPEYATKCLQIPSAEFNYKPAPEKWSKKEVIGHLIDSGQNNLRRFIVGQYAEMDTIWYDQDLWVLSNAYQEMEASEIINLWVMINKRIIAVLKQMPEHVYQNKINTGKQEINAKTLLWLATDYVSHLQHHMHQVLPDVS